MRIRNQSGADSEQCKRLDFQVRGDYTDVVLVDGNVAVILLIHIQVLDQTVVQEVLKRPIALHQLLHVLLTHHRFAFLYDDVRPLENKQIIHSFIDSFKRLRVNLQRRPPSQLM